jgi:DNA-binding MarR family transcriptional regulator
MTRSFIDTEFTILEHIHDAASAPVSLRQRELARKAGTSLGMTNGILKKLAQKGWIIIKRLNSRKIQYAVTLEGINELARRSYRYFKRTIRNVVFYKDRIDQVIASAGARGLDLVILAGDSDLDFIVEHVCHRRGIRLMRLSGSRVPAKYAEDPGQKALFVYAENIPVSQVPPARNAFFLSKIVLEQAAG